MFLHPLIRNEGTITVEIPSLPSIKTIKQNLKALWLGFRYLLYYAFFTGTFTLSFIPIYTYFQFAPDLSSIETLKNKKDTGLILLDRNNRPFFTFYSTRLREEVSIKEIPLYAQKAVISVEDKDFYSHEGFSLKAIVRAAITNIKNRELSYGGSTITQQLTKNTLLTPEKKMIRKYQEVVLASEIERRYSKDQILEMYLNSVYFGKGAFGIQEAAQVYFNKKVNQLNLSESAFLASLLPAPSRLSAAADNDQEIKDRVNLVLQKMMEQKYITSSQVDETRKQTVKLVRSDPSLNAYGAHFALMVRDELIEKYGEENLAKSGFKVKTSLDLDYQKIAEDEVSKQVENLKKSNVSNGSVVVIDPKTGEILAMVGSTNWYDEKFGKVNVSLSPRPPGSSFKPVVYLRAFEKGLITPSTILQDSPKSFANFDEKTYYATFQNKASAIEHLSTDANAYYQPVNYDRKYRGPVTVRRALSNSLNVPAVEVMKKIGVDDVLDYSSEVGISTLEDASNYGLSLVLGTGNVKLLELTNFYASLANKGIENNPVAVLQIEDKYGKLLFKAEENSKKIADEKNVFLLTSILSDNNSRSEMFGTALTINRPAAVKTGTTDDYKDSWTLGYTPSLAIGVWVGNNDGQKMDNVAGSLGAAPIWKTLMTKYSEGKPIEDFEIPAGVVKHSLCLYNKEGKPIGATSEYFIMGTQPRFTGCITEPAKIVAVPGSPKPKASTPPVAQGGTSINPIPPADDKKDKKN